MLTIWLQIASIVLLIVISGLMAMAKTALTQANKVRLKVMADGGNESAAKAHEMACHPERVRTTMQGLVIVIRVVAGAIAGAAVYSRNSSLPDLFPSLTDRTFDTIFAVTILVVAYLSIVLGEMLPKRLGRSYPETIACLSAEFVEALINVTMPLGRLLALSADGLAAMLGIKPPKTEPLTDKELEELVVDGTEAGLINQSEQQMLFGVLRLDQIRISSVMTPRQEFSWLNLSDSSDSIMRKIEQTPHTRFIVADGDLDKALGVVNARDLFVQWHNDQTIDLQRCMFDPLIIPENRIALDVLEDFKKSRTHIAFVFDEYGVLRGLVTMSDIVQAIVGNLQETGDPEPWQVVEREDGTWLIDAITPIHEFKKSLNVNNLPSEKDESFSTVGGFVIHYLEHIPAVSEQFECGGLQFEVIDMDGHRIERILVSRVQKPHESVKH